VTERISLPRGVGQGMESRFRFLGHPLHPMLIVVPSALFPLLLLLDAVHFFSGDDAAWRAGFWVAVAGAVATLAAIVPGVVDMAHIPDGSRAHRTARIHAALGTLTLLAYVVAVWVRWGAGTERLLPAAGVDLVGTLLVSAQGWLGAELVYRHHVGVKTPAEGGDPVTLTGSPRTPSEQADARRRRDARP